MKQDLHHVRRAAALLIAAAALPLSPSFAQDTQTPAPPPAAEPAPPPAAQTPPVDVAAPPAPTVAPEPAPAPAVSIPTAAATRAAPVRTAPTRVAVRTPARTTSVTVRTQPAAAVPVATAATPAPIATTAPLPVETLPATPVAVAPAPPPPAVVPVETQPTDSRARIISLLPWLVGALLLLGIAAFAVARRRRTTIIRDNDYVEPIAEPVVAAAPAMAPAAVSRPWIDLALEPVRAGVEGEEAVVEFALRVDNRGAAPARDVRVSAFMLQAGASEAERHLIAPKEMPAVTLDAGETKQVETAVALPTDKVDGDCVLPVVVADARYTLPDGSEGHTSASFAVGVPDGEELAHFSVENPSGLHEGVVARALGEMEKA